MIRKSPRNAHLSSSEQLTTALATRNMAGTGGIIFFLLLATLVFAPVAFGAVDFWALGILALIAFLVAVLWLFDAWKTGEFSFNTNRLQIPIIGFILIGLIQLLPLRSADVAAGLLASADAVNSLSLDPYTTRFAVVQLCVYLIFFAACLTFIDTTRRLRRTVLFIIIFGSLMAFFGILQRLANPEGIYGVRPTPYAVPFGSFVNQHHFAAFMEMTIGVTLGLLYNKSTKRDKQLLLVIAVVIMGIALIFTSSRGGILSLFGVIGFITLISFLRRQPSENEDDDEDREIGATPVSSFQSKIALVGGGLALILVLFGSILLLGGGESLTRGIGFVNQSDISNGRSHFWSVTLQIIRDYPIFGAGFNAFGVAFTRYDTWNGSLRIEQAHNDYLQIFADAGIFGFACAIAFVYFLFKQGLAKINQTTDRFRRGVAAGALAGCFGILLHSFFDFPLRTPSNAFYFLTLVTLVVVSVGGAAKRQ
ncbi:MAG TPA: O-antigen ligase family protein [Pyrinomonadaceae bacterium]|nr:O-antigen ligase family protein [Pyrinomonadaceae bacterium]